jgi:hypothetical protein
MTIVVDDVPVECDRHRGGVAVVVFFPHVQCLNYCSGSWNSSGLLSESITSPVVWSCPPTGAGDANPRTLCNDFP